MTSSYNAGLSASEFQSYLSAKANVIPLSKKLMMDSVTPITLAYAFQDANDICFLEGMKGTSKFDRFSFLAIESKIRIRAFQNHIEVVDSKLGLQKTTENLFSFLENFLKKFKTPAEPRFKYHAGILGYLTYECASYAENIPLPRERNFALPFAEFILPERLVIMDSLEGTMELVQIVFCENADASQALSLYEKGVASLKEFEEKTRELCKTPAPVIEALKATRQNEVKWHVEKADFLKKVEICKDYIAAGDIFQIQVSRRAEIPVTRHPFEIYRRLRNLNPSPFMYYFKTQNSTLLGTSPELLVEVEDREIHLCPIAGTRKRHSQDRTEDEVISELLNDEKEKAEHIMLVDLARNDIGRVANYGTVKVTDLMTIEKYSHVIHMVSNVKGTLKEGMTCVDALKSGFPAGTVTGAPKIRAMEIISELETEQREFYAGGLAFFDFQGNLKSALTIRSILVKDGVGYTQAAAGIVADSIPEMELKETENKLRACLEVLAT